MNRLSLFVGAAVAALALAPACAMAQKSMSDQEINSIVHGWELRCGELAVAEGRPALQKSCMRMVLSDVAEVDQLQRDSAVTDEMWNLCKIESGFNHTQDFHQWAACMRVAKTRTWLRTQ
jgi:hypothetical protein